MLVINFLGMCAAVSFIIWVVYTGRRKTRTVQAMIEFHNRLLEKIGSAKDFSDFLQSEGGNRFLESMTLERPDPNHRILGSIQTGSVLTMLGLGLMACGFFTHKGFEIWMLLGTISGSLGVGFLISSGVAYYLSRTWGLLDSRRQGREAKTEPYRGA